MTALPLVSPVVDALPRYQAGRSIEQVRRELGLREVIKLASNECPFGPSPRAVEAMARALAGTHRYPDDGLDLREKIGAHLGVPAAQVVLGAGCTDLIELCVRTFVTPREHAVVSAGSFLAYRLFLLSAGVPLTEAPLARDLSIDLDAMLRAVRPETKLIFIPNPNNPTGTRFGRAELDRFAGELRPDVVLALDDAYVDYCDADDAPDTLAVFRRRPRTVVLRSFSKAHGLAGMRIGYLVASEELCACLMRVARPFAVTRVAIEGAKAAMDDVEHLRRTVRSNRAGREYLGRALAELGFPVLPSATNFVTIHLGSGVEAFARFLLERGLIVRPLSPFGLPEHVRISVGEERENELLVSAVRDWTRAQPDLGGPKR